MLDHRGKLMKTLDEATRTIFPKLDESTKDQFILMRGTDLMADISVNKGLETILSHISASVVMFLIQGRDDPVSSILSGIKECTVIGIAVGMEMEKSEYDINSVTKE